VRKGAVVIAVGLFALLAIGLYLPPPKVIDASYLLAVVSAVGTLGGIAFALYGWYSAKELPRMIDEKVNEYVKKIERHLEDKMYRQQEAMQKVIASYSVNDLDIKISLLKQAVEADPTVYNGYVALAYAYLENGDFLAAEEHLHNALKHHPKNYQAACDLAFLFAKQKEWYSALSWMKEAIKINPKTWEDFESDPRFDELRKQLPDEYKKIIEEAKRRV
jgi:tetratricopeptide (TPR) repeat protein